MQVSIMKPIQVLYRVCQNKTAQHKNCNFSEMREYFFANKHQQLYEKQNLVQKYSHVSEKFQFSCWALYFDAPCRPTVINPVYCQ